MPDSDVVVRPLDKLLALIAKYVVMTDSQRLIVALWIVHTHIVEHADQTPYLTITSPEKQCGKSRLLELLDLLVARSWSVILPSEAVFYRTINAVMPTVLLDEVDAIFAPKVADRHEHLRAALNAGHRKGAQVPRCVGPTQTVQLFDVFSAKALAGIGVLPDTITDRSIPIRLQRKTKAEKVARFNRRQVKFVTDEYRQKLIDWAGRPAPADMSMSNGEWIATLRPEVPEGISDRAQEGCEILVALADAWGYHDEVRAALLEIVGVGVEREDERETASLHLLSDVRDVFLRYDVLAFHTETLLAELHDGEGGWDSWYGRGLNANDLAAMLRPYGVHSKNVKVNGVVRKGYHADSLADVWSRYLAPSDGSGMTAVTSEVTPDLALQAEVTPVTPNELNGHKEDVPFLTYLPKEEVTGVTGGVAS